MQRIQSNFQLNNQDLLRYLRVLESKGIIKIHFTYVEGYTIFEPAFETAIYLQREKYQANMDAIAACLNQVITTTAQV